MICPNCRTEIPDDSQACTKCGTPVLHPRVVDAEIIPPDHPGQSDTHDAEYRHPPQGVHFSRVFYTTFPSEKGVPPACLPTFISLGLALVAAFKYGLLAAIGFLVFAGVGRLITFFMTVQHWMEGKALNPWVLHVVTWGVCWLLVAWLSGDLG